MSKGHSKDLWCPKCKKRFPFPVIAVLREKTAGLQHSNSCPDCGRVLLFKKRDSDQ